MKKQKIDMIDFKNLGYKDITKDNPIRFSESFGETFGVLYHYKQRFVKKENNIVTILKVGTHDGITDIAGVCYYPKGWQKFEVHALSKYAKEELDKTINAVKYKIKKLIDGTVY